MRALLALCVLATFAASTSAQFVKNPTGVVQARQFRQLTDAPPGEVFFDEVVTEKFDSPIVGLSFDDLGRIWAWGRQGTVYVVPVGSEEPEAVLDITEEVANWSAHGLMSVALDPDFLNNGYVYLYYAVDYHHLMNFGTPAYDPAVDEPFIDTMARITRYQVQGPCGLSPGQCSCPGAAPVEVPGSRTILVGDVIGDGPPICGTTHAVGTILFGEDGSLLYTFGDSFSSASGGNCLSDGLLQSKADLNAWRSQLLDTQAGKILRIDPATGEGMMDNPFYDVTEPRAPRSRVWTLGVRQPFRMSVRPGTGGFTPGVLYLGDVGGSTWEEVNVIDDAALNLGWPMFEGLELRSSASPVNPDAPNPLFGQTIPGQGTCNEPFFEFADLLVQENESWVIDLPNPCDPSQQIPANLTWMHTRPKITWRHDLVEAVSGTFDGSGNATSTTIGAPGSPVIGAPFEGECAIGGVWYTGTDFPERYHNTYFVADYAEGWIRSIRFDIDNNPTEVIDLTSQAGDPVAMATHPTDGGLYYIRISERVVRRIGFLGDLPPTAAIGADKYFGPGPLTVAFDGSGSDDPEGKPLQFSWDFGDGQTSNLASPNHTFTPSTGDPTAYTVRLTVEDAVGLTDDAEFLVSVNNTPPVASITSPLNGDLYHPENLTALTLTHASTDAESPVGDLVCSWQVTLHHDDHTHPEPEDPSCSTTANTGPENTVGDREFYSVTLTVTDPGGLSSSARHLLPVENDCNLNGFPDRVDIESGASLDLNNDEVPDECESDCDGDGLPDPFEIIAQTQFDCDGNGEPDACTIANDPQTDLDLDGVLDSCQSLSSTIGEISEADGGELGLRIRMGAALGRRMYWVFGSMNAGSGRWRLGDVDVPLIAGGPYHRLTLQHPNAGPLDETRGFLDDAGEATATVRIPAGIVGLAGTTLEHAAVIFEPGSMEALAATGASQLRIVP